MKKSMWWGGSLAGCLFAAGCLVQSLQPFYTADAVVAMPQLNGSWRMLGKDFTNQPPWQFKDNTIETRDEKGGTGDLKVTYFKVKDQLFMDTLADDIGEGRISSWWRFHVSPIHCLSQVTWTEKRMVIRPLSPEWFQQTCKDKKLNLSLAPRDEKEVPFSTATPAQWMAFLAQYGSSDEAFPTKGQYELERLTP